MEITDFSISALDRKLHRRKPWYYRIALSLIALAFGIVGLVSSFEPAEAMEETPRCMTNAECCEQWAAGAFINSQDSEIAALCAEYL